MVALLTVILFLQESSVEDLIRALRSDKVEERNRAGVELKKRGEAVIPQLEKAAKDSNLELSAAAKELILDIRDPLRGETAEETYKRMDDAIRSAKTIRVVMQTDFTRGEAKPDYDKKSGGILMIKGEKVLVEPADPSKPGAAHMELICDGTTVANFPKYPPKMFREDLLCGLTRAGMAVTLYVAVQAPNRTEPEFVTVSPPKLKGRDVLGRVIEYEATFEGGEPLDVRLWVDLKTRLPVQFVASTRGQGENYQRFWERYEGWVLGGEIPDEKFIPKDPKKK